MERDLNPRPRTARQLRTTPNWVRSSAPWPRTGTARRSASTSRPGANAWRAAGARPAVVRWPALVREARRGRRPGRRRDARASGRGGLPDLARSRTAVAAIVPVHEPDRGCDADGSRAHAFRQRSGACRVSVAGPPGQRRAPERDQRPDGRQRVSDGRSGSTGTAGTALPWERGGWNSPLPRPGGGWVCVCGTYTPGNRVRRARGSPSRSRRSTRRVRPPDRPTVRTLQSEIDPAQARTSDSFTVDARATASPDGRYALVGWSERTATGWHAGVDVVDLATLQVVDRPGPCRRRLPVGRRPGPVVVALAPGRGYADRARHAALITEDWFVDEPTADRRHPGQITGRRRSKLAMFGPVSDAGRAWVGLATSGSAASSIRSTYYVACISSRQRRGVIVERYDAAGGSIDRPMSGSFTGFGAFAARPDHRLFLWDPQSHTLTSYDLQTGNHDTASRLPRRSANAGPLDVDRRPSGRAIGSIGWPRRRRPRSCSSRPWRQPGRDSAVCDSASRRPFESIGSAGVFAFDISGDSRTFKSHWAAHRRLHLARGERGRRLRLRLRDVRRRHAAGVQAPYVQASVTVFDATDGVHPPDRGPARRRGRAGVPRAHRAGRHGSRCYDRADGSDHARHRPDRHERPCPRGSRHP